MVPGGAYLTGVPQGDFLALLRRENNLDGGPFVAHEGMCFASAVSWWGKMAPRMRPHEGVDICRYARKGSKRRTLAPGTRIPVTFDGVVWAMMADDFMGRSICIEHDVDGVLFLSVYAHVEPVAGLEPGQHVKAGDVIAALSDPKQWGLGICPHLHLSLMQINKSEADLSPSDLHWESLWETPGLHLYNPEPLLGEILEISDEAADAMLWDGRPL